MRKWLLVLMLPVLTQEAHLFWVMHSEPWVDAFNKPGPEAVSIMSGEIRCELAKDSDACGAFGNTLTITGRTSLQWRAEGSYWLKVSRARRPPRFLTYQPVNSLGSEAGVYLIAQTASGYERQALSTNPVSLFLRSSWVVLAVGFLTALYLLEGFEGLLRTAMDLYPHSLWQSWRTRKSRPSNQVWKSPCFEHASLLKQLRLSERLR